MNKSLILVMFLLSVIAVETGYIAFREEMILTNGNSSTLNFSAPQSGKDIYEDLKSLGCRIYKSDVDLRGSESSFGGYVAVPSYNAFCDLAREEIIIVYQYLTVTYQGGSYNRTSVLEYAYVFLIKEEQSFYTYFRWQFTRNGNVTEQLINERKIPL